MQRYHKIRICIILWALCVSVLLTCSKDKENNKITLSVWFHSGQQSERQTFIDQVNRFNKYQNLVTISATMIPEGSYNGQVQAAAVAGDLPDLLEFDGPYVYNYVWQGILRPIGDLLGKKLMDDLIPSIINQGTYHGRFYSVGVYDSGLGLYSRKSLLQKVDARIPAGPADAWTIDEFDHILKRLAGNDPDREVLDLKLNYSGEYITYAFSPILQSAGADLIDRSNYQHASGVLNSPAAISAMTHVQSWFLNQWVDPNLDDAAFTGGRAAFSWVGHWEYKRYYQAWKNDLVVLPLPDFGKGSRTGQGSWNWGITCKCSHPDAAARFLKFLLSPDEVLAMCRANSAVPATRTALEKSKLYGEGGPLRLFAIQLTQGYSVPRPKTPAYPVISSVFAEAFSDIRNKGNVRSVLTDAAKDIDRDIRYNDGYPVIIQPDCKHHAEKKIQ